jgi:serine/threonine-protein kinase
VATAIDSGWSWDRVGVNNNGISLSPDGSRLAVVARASNSDDIRIKQLETGPFTRLTFDGAAMRPLWSRDGRHVWYISRDSISASLYRRRADGTGSPVLVLDPANRVEEVVETPDSAVMIVRVSLPGGAAGRRIYLFRPAAGTGDSALTPLLDSPDFNQVSPALSPDGRWLAYVSNESGRDEVYVRPFPNVEGGRWQVSRDGGTEPAWAHSGKELYFRSAGANGGRGSVVAVPVLPGQGFVMGEQKELFRDRYLRDQWHAQYVVTPDDRRFIFVQDVSAGDDGTSAPSASMILIQHWLAELDLGRPGGR